MPQAAAIYARISFDPSAQALGVERQVEDCKREAGRRGWHIAEVYVDNGRSAFSGKPRPEYDRMMADVADGYRDAIMVWKHDRLHRQPKELEEFFEVCDAAGLTTLATVQGDVDLATSGGKLYARIMGTVAANESQVKGERVRSKMQANAKAGKPHGPSRPYGYQADKVTLEPTEAAIVKDLAERLLAGESLSSLVRWLNESGIATATGRGEWRTSSLRMMLLNGRLSGQRDFKGETVGPAVWPAIITIEQTDRIRALLNDPARRTNRTARRYLLAGMLRCDLCGSVLMAHPRNGERRYACKTGADFTGCGRIYIKADPVEQLVADAVLYRLDTPALADALAGRSSGDQAATLVAQALEADRVQLNELAAMYGKREIGAGEWRAARAEVDQRIGKGQRDLARLNGSSAVSAWVGNGSGLRAQWSGLNLDRQRAIVRAVLDHAVVASKVAGANDFRPERVRPVWKL